MVGGGEFCCQLISPTCAETWRWLFPLLGIEAKGQPYLMAGSGVEKQGQRLGRCSSTGVTCWSRSCGPFRGLNDYVARDSGKPSICNTFPGYSSRGDTDQQCDIIPHSKGVKCGLIHSKSPLSLGNHCTAKRKSPKPLVYAQVSPLGSPFCPVRSFRHDGLYLPGRRMKRPWSLYTVA